MGIPHPDPISGASYSAVELSPGDREALLLDQRKLPVDEEYVRIRSADEMARAIRDMVVRGAPAIGIAAAYGMVLAAQSADSPAELDAAARQLEAARPTAVNLSWAVRLMRARAAELSEHSRSQRLDELSALARRIHGQDVANNRRMGALGAARLADGATVLTHCNAGALATGGYGTALGVIRAAVEAGKQIRVLADETRPFLQGSRLTAWELSRDGIDVSVIADGASGSLFSVGRIDAVVVGADRIAASGDVANKIGTYTVATLARAHERPFYVAAPMSTVDLATASGAEIEIEQRSPKELTEFGGAQLVPSGAGVLNPAFDVTPARLVTAIFTERGVVEPVSAASFARLAAHSTGGGPGSTSLG